LREFYASGAFFENTCPQLLPGAYFFRLFCLPITTKD